MLKKALISLGLINLFLFTKNEKGSSIFEIYLAMILSVLVILAFSKLLIGQEFKHQKRLIIYEQKKTK
jgi:hypothetical protein